MIQLFGVSGGSFVSGWAVALQPTYAPELNLAAAALGGFVTDVTLTLKSLDGGYWAGFIATGLGGLMNEYPELKTYLQSITNSDRLNEFQDYCAEETLDRFHWTRFFTDPFKFFTQDWNSMSDDNILKKILAENSLINYNQTPTIPIFIFHGSLDGIVPITNSFEIYDKWCSGKIKSLEFAEDLTAGHLTEGHFGGPAAFTWMQKRFNGEPPVLGCSHQKRLNNLLYPDINLFVIQIVKDKFNEVFSGLGKGIQQDKPTTLDYEIYINRTNEPGVQTE